jgi:purine-binding chemotaxis protein CheW
MCNNAMRDQVDHVADVPRIDDSRRGAGLYQYLTFLVGEKPYCVEITYVDEIRVASDISEIPNAAKFLLGVTNIRGQVIPIFDLKARFNLGKSEVDTKKVIIVCSVEDQDIGILVDSVSDIIHVKPEEIKESKSAQLAIKGDFVSGVIVQNKEMIVLLDLVSLFGEGSLKEIKKMLKNEEL